MLAVRHGSCTLFLTGERSFADPQAALKTRGRRRWMFGHRRESPCAMFRRAGGRMESCRIAWMMNVDRRPSQPWGHAGDYFKTAGPRDSGQSCQKPTSIVSPREGRRCFPSASRISMGRPTSQYHHADGRLTTSPCLSRCSTARPMRRPQSTSRPHSQPAIPSLRKWAAPWRLPMRIPAASVNEVPR